MKKLVLVIDHDRKRGNELKRELLETRKPVSSRKLEIEYEFSVEIVKGEEDKFVSEARKLALKYRTKSPCALMVDLVIPHDERGVPGGIRLLEAIKREFPRLPVALYTRQGLRKTPAYQASKSIADAIVEVSNTHEVAAILVDMFDNGRQNSMDKMSGMLVGLLGCPSYWEAEWAVGASAKGEFRRAVEALTWEIFRAQGEIHRVFLQTMNPGFSGTQLVKVNAHDAKGRQLPNEWVLKVAEHKDEIAKLQKEIEGYHVMQDKLDKRYRPELHRSTAQAPVTLAEHLWGALALSFEPDFKTLLDVFEDLRASDIYKKLFEDCLSPVYGLVDSKPTLQILAQDTVEQAVESIEQIGRWIGPVSRYYHEIESDIAAVLQASKDDTFVKIESAAMSGCGFGFRHIHGDLNCRNIMVDSKTKEFRIIDFPHVLDTDLRPAATDFAKAEMELLFIIMDYHTGLDIDPARVSVWTEVLRILCGSLTGVSGADPPVTGLNNLFECLAEVRRSYATTVGNDEDSWRQYRLLLLDNCCRYLSYKDLTPAKRCLVIVYARKLLDSL